MRIILQTVWMAMALSGCAWLHAGTILFTSNGTALDAGEWNDFGQTVAIAPNAAWAAALPNSSWVSYGQTGAVGAPGYFMPPTPMVLSFYQTIRLPLAPSLATITIRADDSTSLFINQMLVVPEAKFSGNTYSTCSDFSVGCTLQTQLTVDITSFLREGDNTLRFGVAQRNAYSFGVNYAGSATWAEATVPEPATMAMFGLGLIGLALARRKVKRG